LARKYTGSMDFTTCIVDTVIVC